MDVAPYVSVLPSEEESDDADESALAGLRESGKPMKYVGKRVLQIGKQCMDHFHHVLEEEEREVAAVKKALVDYHATIDSLHDKYAIEIQKREDALATASAEKEQEVRELQAEIKRMQDAIVQQQNEAAAKLATVQADAEATKKAALERTAASEAALKKIKVDPGTLAKDSLEAIMKDVLQSYKDKAEAWVAQQPPAATAAPAAPAIPKPVASVWIKQKNTNTPTVRELTYQSSPSMWFFDASDKTNDPTAQANLTEITDPAAVTALAGLGSFTAVRKKFKPRVGNKTTYSVGYHSYEVEVVQSVKPWEEAHYQQQLPKQQLPKQQHAAPPKHMLLEGPFFRPSKDQIKAYSENLDTSAEMSEVIGHKQLAELATYWSSYSQGFKYDETTTELWVKPKWLSTWLNTLKHSDNEIRIVAHGVRSSDFSALAKDPRGFNLAMCRFGRATGVAQSVANPQPCAVCGIPCNGSHGFGIYVSPLDCIPADYTVHTAAHKDGTFVLGLLQVPKPSATAYHSTTTSPSSYQVDNGAIEFYHLGSRRKPYLAAGGENDAYNVRDQTLFLTLGMVTTK
tara:strand:- start:7128 stop:8834 length:1707 start_codon:yes stop_codon:yes gene_type:complete